MLYEKMAHHVACQCPNRGVSCNLCGKIVLQKNLKAHGEECEFRPWTCPLCNVTCPSSMKAKHKAEECSNRVVVCDWDGEKVFHSQLLQHKQKRSV